MDALGCPETPTLLLLHVVLILPDHVRWLQSARERSPGTRLLMAACDDDPSRRLAALTAGVDGLMDARATARQVEQVLEDVAAGGGSIGPVMTRHVLERLRHPPTPAAPDYGLSAGEREILEQLLRGLTTKEVAAVLDLPYHRVDRRMRDLYGKLGEHTRGGVVAKATRERLLEGTTAAPGTPRKPKQSPEIVSSPLRASAPPREPSSPLTNRVARPDGTPSKNPSASSPDAG